MNRLVLSCLGISGLLVANATGCGATTATPPSETGGAERPSDGAPDEGAARVWFLWGQTSDQHMVVDLQTVWVREHTDGRAELLGAVPGLVASDGTYVYRPAETHVGLRRLDCDCANDLETRAHVEMGRGDEVDYAPCAVDGTARATVLQALDSGRVVELGPLVSDVDARAFATDFDHVPVLSSFEQTIRWAGGAGPLLMAVTCTYESECESAHGETACTLRTIDLAAQRIVEPPEELLEAAAHAPTPAAVVEAWTTLHEDVPLSTEPVLKAITPALRQDGAFVWLYEHLLEACYACSDGYWGSYTATVIQPSAHVSAPPDAFAPPPASVVDVALQQLGGVTVRGWSVYEGPVDVLRELGEDGP
jgi:hypothetical protein